MNRRTICFTACFCAVAALAGCRAPQAGARTSDADFNVSADQKPRPKMLQGMARVLAAQGKEAEAFSVLRRLQMEYPDYIPVYAELAEHHLRQNRAGEAERILLEGLERAPKDAILINDLGMVAMMRGEHQQALEHFTAAADLAPGEARHRANLATVLGLMGRYDESYAVFEQVVPPAFAHHNVSILAQGRGDTERAASEHDAAVALDPGLAGNASAAQGSPPADAR
jgi:Flp pilus assembly protein TadD